MRIVEIRKVPEVITEGSEFEYQALRYPFYANHDRNDELNELGNAVFAKVHPDAVNPVKVYEETMEIDGSSQLISVVELLNRVSSLMLAEDRTRPIHLYQSQASQLNKSDIWRLWCCKHDTKEDLEEDYKKVFGTGLDLRKNLLTLKIQVKEAIKNI